MTTFSRRARQKLSKLSSEQIRRLFDSLYDEDETFDAVLESLSVGLIVCDTRGRLLMMNKAAERVMPFVFPRPAEREISVWELIDDYDIADFLKSSITREKTNVSEQFSLSVGGGIRFLSVGVVPLVRQARVIGNIISAEDITEKRTREILFRRLESLASLTNLAASVAHEIKNPLASLSIRIELIQKTLASAREKGGELPKEEQLERHLSVVTEEIERLNTIIMDFLLAVRPVSAQLELLSPIDLIKECLEFFYPELEKKHIMLTETYCGDGIRVMLDAKLFRQMLVNLIQNAQQAMEGGGELRISTMVKDEQFIIEIADSGMGMDEKTAERVFEPYFTTRASGTGLGLTMVYKIVREFGGDIRLDSTLGLGSTFSISLPLPQRERRLLEYTKEG